MDIAQLGYSIDSRPLVSGKQRLREFGDEGDRAGRSVGALGASAKRGFGAVAIAATAALGALASVGSAIRTISEFETSMSRLGAISGATTDQLAAMRDVARDLGATTEFSAMQAADGLNFLSMAGFSASESMAAISSVLDLATASGMGLAQAADTASNIMSGFGIAAEDAAEVADVLAAASSRANTDVGQLGDAMSTVAPISAALGISLADTAAAIGVLSDAGIQGARAGTAMRGVLASLAGPTTEAVEVLQRLGLTIDDINPETNDLAVVMGRLGDAGLSTADAMKIFGREAASGALVLVDGARRLGEFGDELERVDGAAGDMADTMRDNLGGDIKGLQSAVSGLMITMGDAGLTAIIRGVVQAVTLVTRSVSGLVSAFSEATGYIRSFLGGVSAAQQVQLDLQAAVDSTSIAIGDQVNASNFLKLSMEQGNLTSLAVVQAELAKAQARYADVSAMEAQRIEQAKSSDAYQAILSQIQDAKSLVRSTSMFDAEQMENAELSVIRALDHQREYLALLMDGSALSANEASLKSQIEQNIIALTEKQNALNGLTDYNVELSDRVSASVAGINFGTAIGGAEALAQRLGVSLSVARQIAAVAGTANVGDEVFDPRSDRFNQAAQDAANREAKLKEIRDSFEDIGVEAVAAGRSVSGLSSAIDDVAVASELASAEVVTFSDVFEGNMLDAMRNTSDIFADGWDGIVSKIKGSLLDAAKFAVLNPIKVALGIGGTATGAGMAGGLSGGGILGGLSAASGAFGSGLAVAGNGLLAGGLGGAATASMGAISGGIGMGGIAGFATAAGAALPWVAGAAAIVSFFSTKTKTIDKGIRATVDMENAAFESFKEIQKSKFWGLSKSNSTDYTALSGDEASPFADLTSQVQQSVLGAADSLGLSADVLEGFSTQFKVSLKGLDDAAKNQAIADAFEGLGDEMAARILGWDIADATSDAFSELTRLSNSLVTVNGAFRDMGFSLFNVSVAGADAASQFADLFDSLEGFTAASGAYYEAFYSDQEKLANASLRMSELLGDLGVNVMPATNSAFRELVDTAMLAGDLDLASELIKIGPSFASVTDAANNLASALRSNVNEDAFATGLDYQRALSRAGNGLEYTPGQRDAEIADLKASNAMMQSTLEIIAANTGKAADNTENQLAITEESML